jgi:hypothetical protein
MAFQYLRLVITLGGTKGAKTATHRIAQASVPASLVEDERGVLDLSESLG